MKMRYLLINLSLLLLSTFSHADLLQETDNQNISALLTDAEVYEPFHGGGLNACGCHFNRKTGTCHCHQDRGCGCACQSPSCPTKSDDSINHFL